MGGDRDFWTLRLLFESKEGLFKLKKDLEERNWECSEMEQRLCRITEEAIFIN
jgi:hypothetical protein